MNSNIYSVVERGSNQLLSQPLLSRKLARVYKKMFSGTEVEVVLYKYRQMSKRVVKASHLQEFFTKEEREAYGKLLKKNNKKKRKSPTKTKSYTEKEMDELDELERYFEEEYNDQGNDDEDEVDDED